MTPAPFQTTTVLVATVAATLLGLRAWRKKTLTPAGAITGMLVGFAIVATGVRGLILFYFYQVGTWATKYRLREKQGLDGSVETAAVRGPGQVLCASIGAVLLSLVHAVVCGVEQPIAFPKGTAGANEESSAVSKDQVTVLASQLTCGILAHHATSLADTLASEMGILASQPPFLVTQPWRSVPAGTNGGVTMSGFLWSFVGGSLIGSFYVVTDYLAGTTPVHVGVTILFGGLCGLLGSLVDSVLGATVQTTFYHVDEKKVYPTNNSAGSLKHVCGADILNNEQVNLVSLAITMSLGGWILGPLFFSLFT